MKKIIVTTIMTAMMSMPSMCVFADSDGAAIAAGLLGGAMLTGIASQSGRGARRDAAEARREAEKAQQETEMLRREQQQEKFATIEKRLAGKTINFLLLAIAILFAGLIALGAIVLRRKR